MMIRLASNGLRTESLLKLPYSFANDVNRTRQVDKRYPPFDDVLKLLYYYLYLLSVSMTSTIKPN